MIKPKDGEDIRKMVSLGAQVQENECLKYCEENGYEVVGTYKDIDISSRVEPLHRDAFSSLLKDMREGDTLLYYKRDRIARDTYQMIHLESHLKKNKLNFIDVSNPNLSMYDDNPTNRLMRTVLDAISQHEVETIRLRSKKALKQKRANGFRTGGIPYGYQSDEDGKLSYCDLEQSNIRHLQTCRDQGLSYAKIAVKMNKFSRNRSGKWLTNAVYRILKNLPKRLEEYNINAEDQGSDTSSQTPHQQT